MIARTAHIPCESTGSILMLYFGLLAAFVLEYTRPSTYLPFLALLKINTLVPVLVFLASVYAQRPASTGDVLRHRNARWFAVFLVLLLLGPLHADVKLYAIEALKVVFAYLLMAFTVAKLIDDFGKLKGFVLTLILCHVALVILNPQLITNPETRHYIEGVTFLGDGNDFALSACLLIPLSLYLYLDATAKWKRVVYMGLTVLLTLGIIGTSSRGAVLALASFVLYMWWRSRRKVLGLVFVGIGVAGVLVFASDLFFQRMGTISQYQEEGSAMGRIMAWTAATQMANDNPLLGVGGAHFSVKFGVEYRPQDFVGPLPWLNAHSIYFMMLAEFGYPGLLILLGSLFYCFRTGERILKEVRGSGSAMAGRYERMFFCLNGSLIAFSVGAAFLSALYYPHWYVVMGLYIAAELMYRRDRAKILAEATPENSAARATPNTATYCGCLVHVQ